MPGKKAKSVLRRRPTRRPITYTYCITSNCALAEQCARHEDDAGKHLLTRTYADFSEERIKKPDGTVTGPFFIDKNEAP